MKYTKYYILVLMAATMLAACHEDDDFAGQNVEFCVRAAWQNGLDGSVATRALTSTDILADGTTDIVIATDDYPSTINVHCNDGNDFVLTKGASKCNNHPEYWSYSTTVLYKDKMLVRHELEFNATAVVDATNTNPELGDVVEGSFDYRNLHDGHILLTLHHTKALVRFAFTVNDQYDKIRYIKVTGIKLNGTDCYVEEAVLNKGKMTLIAYAYINPSHDAQGNALTGSGLISTDTENTIECTYNIYDKDDDSLDHLTRKDVVAKNTFKLNSLKDKSNNLVKEIKSGYYYDLKVTLNPDYLYVLSEHDNKHITIN